MRLSKVVATDIQTKETQTFTFDTAVSGKKVVTARGNKLNGYLEYCFKEGVECPRDVEVEFVLDKDAYSLARLHNEDGTTRCVLKKMVEDRWQVVARTKAVSYIEEIVQEQLADLVKADYISSRAIADFHGDLTLFDSIRMLIDVQKNVAKTAQDAQEMKQGAMRKVKAFTSLIGSNVTTDKLDEVNAELDAVARDLADAKGRLGELKAKQSVGGLRGDILQDLRTAQTKYSALIARKDAIEALRSRIAVRDELESFIPRVKALRAAEEQRELNERKRYALSVELQYQEDELASVSKQLELRDRQFALTQDRRAKLQAINSELEFVASLYEQNKVLNESLVELTDTQQKLTNEKIMYLDKLREAETAITEVRASLDEFKLPTKTVGELLETVRVDVKVDEVRGQVEKLQGEIAVKESQIAEKESQLVVLVKRFRSVAELDVAIAPIKAKDTLIQVLDAKHRKIETVNESLTEKLRNLERALDDYKFRLAEVEQSNKRLEAQRDKLLLCKQEEFKREVYFNSQKVYSDDATSVFAVQANFHDTEMDAIDQEIADRAMDRDLLMERAYTIEGSIKEIKRHIDINNAEMQSLQKEKETINARYNDIVAQNSSEAVFNYLKALASENETKYLLDVQQDAVRCEAELYELRRSVETMRSKLATLKSRLKYLLDTQQQLVGTQGNVDSLVVTNDKLRDELSDIGERLSASYEQFRGISRQIESIDSKLEDINGKILEVTKTVKVNEDQIALANERAVKYAGSEDIEKAIASFKYEIGDVENERQMFVEAKQALEQEVFNKRLELEKAEWLYQAKVAEYNELYNELSFDLNVKGLNVDSVAKTDLAANLDVIRALIAKYDSVRATLANRIQHLYNIIKNHPVSNVSDQRIASLEQDVEILTQHQQELEQQRKRQMDLFVASNKAKMKITVAAAQANTVAELSSSLSHNNIIGLLIDDKIRSVLSDATPYLNALTEGKYKLDNEDGKVVVVDGDNRIAYDELPEEVKSALYISLVLSIPNTDKTGGRWLVFDDRIAMDKDVLAKMLLDLDNISYVVDYARVKEEQ